MTKISSKTGIVNRDDMQVNPATLENQEIGIKDTTSHLSLFRQLLEMIRPMSKVLTGRPYLAVDVVTMGTLSAVTTVTTVTTVASLTNQVNMGGMNAFTMQYNMAQVGFTNGIRNNIT